MSQSELNASDGFRRIGGAILAAGRSRRMGKPKALLQIPRENDMTFAEKSVSTLKTIGVSPIVIVVNDETRAAISQVLDKDVIVAVNPSPEDGMVSSILTAIASVNDDLDALFVTLVDIPEVRVTAATALLDHNPSDGDWMLVPEYSDGAGHPLVILRSAFKELRTELPQGLKSLMKRDPGRIVRIGVSGTQPWDVDTPKDYERFSG